MTNLHRYLRLNTFAPKPRYTSNHSGIKTKPLTVNDVIPDHADIVIIFDFAGKLAL